MTSDFLFEPPSDKDVCKGMIERHETDMDLETCISFLFNTSVLVVILLLIKNLVEVVASI